MDVGGAELELERRGLGRQPQPPAVARQAPAQLGQHRAARVDAPRAAQARAEQAQRLGEALVRRAAARRTDRACAGPSTRRDRAPRPGPRDAARS
jgi:hypothetical protein